MTHAVPILRKCLLPAVAATLALACALLAPTAQAASTKTLPPVAGSFDYQIGGDYPPAAGVQIVSRDHGGSPAPGLYNICYINAFQTQPGKSGDWAENLILHKPGSTVRVEDEGWPGEYLLDIRTATNRTAILDKVKVWIDECASKGFDAIEPDNYDSYTRSTGLIDDEHAVEFMKLLVQYAHAKNLAIAQKNTLELADRAASLGIDFAVIEECGVIWPDSTEPECPTAYAAFGNRVIDIEYTDAGMTRACNAYAGVFSIVQRDTEVTVGGPRKTCPGSTPSDTQAPSAPTGLTATGSTSSSVSLSWSAATDNVGVTGYDVYRDGNKVGTTSGRTYTDSGLAAGTTHRYQVKAKDAAGNVSAGSNTVSKATLSGGTSKGCSATFVVTDSWSGAFDAEVRVKNTGTTATGSWKVTWTWPGNQKVTESWDTVLTQNGSAVTAANDAYNGSIAAGGTKALGLMASGTVPSPLPTVTCTAS
ncbi:endo alpha-1,4 polygalactosaminidase [Streptomyces sp. NPDC001046]|uniref:endo alpha-1,4 polygalactosaminidase n=1 Tax=Streptomyces sp. NPDC001046 TaxID=3364543 RepID=UPI00369EE34C